MPPLKAWKGDIHKNVDSTLLQEALKDWVTREDEVANVAMSILSQQRGDSVYLPRKATGLGLKFIFPRADDASFLLLPKKEESDLSGSYKWGRKARLCSLVAGGWQICSVWNLTARRERQECFREAREKEKMVPEGVTPHCYFDFEYASGKRSCFYERYEPLIERISDLQDRAFLISGKIAQKVLLLHQEGLVWKDLKPENILISPENEIFLCDLDSVEKVCVRKIFECMTPAYTPPEQLLAQESDLKTGDVYAFGVLLFTLVTDFSPPWVTKNRHRSVTQAACEHYAQHAEKARSQLEKEGCSEQRVLYLLALWAMHPDSSRRPTIEGICDYLSKNYKKGEAIAQAEINDYFRVEESGCCTIL